MKTVLNGHTSAETAYVVNDYPYGFTLRCKIRYWIETRKNHGMRFVSQTTNPKRPGEVWNKPKASTYSPLIVMYLNSENNHVEIDALNMYGSTDRIANFRQQYGAQIEFTPAMLVLEGMERINRRMCEDTQRRMNEQFQPA